MAENIQQINCLFSDLIRGLEKVEKLSNGLVQSYKIQADIVNKLYAYRIMEYLAVNEGKILNFCIDDIINVERDEKSHIIIKCNNKFELNTSQLDGVIAEKVIIK